MEPEAFFCPYTDVNGTALKQDSSPETFRIENPNLLLALLLENKRVVPFYDYL